MHYNNSIVPIINSGAMVKSDSTAYSSVHKALTLLEAFIPHNEEISALAMSKVAGIHKSTTTRLLATLRDRGFLDQNPTNKKFTLGFKIKELYQSYENSFHSHLIERAAPHMDELRDCLQDSIVLGIPSAKGIQIIHMAEGTRPLRLKSNIGTINPFNTSAGGKLLLAFSSTAFQSEILLSELEQRTPNSISDPQKLKAELSKIVKQGYSVDQEENNLGIRGLAVPIHDPSNTVIASLIVAGSSHTVSEDITEYLIEKLQGTAKKISTLI